jgi:phosphoribosylformylglycinamidine synthase
MLLRIYRRLSETAEVCFNISARGELTLEERSKVFGLISETFEPGLTDEDSFFSGSSVLEIGPRLAFETPFSSNAVSICRAMGITNIGRIEPSMRYFCKTDEERAQILATKFDRMTQLVYVDRFNTLDSNAKPELVRIVPLLEEGIGALEKANKELGLGMDKKDMEYYFQLFTEVFKRNPTDVELFQIGNANSEHCRHWFFKGFQIINGVKMPESLLDLVKKPLKVIEANHPDQNVSLAAFNDNSGVIKGRSAIVLVPDSNNMMLMVPERRAVDLTATAETHNHPTAVAPGPGAETGDGGMERDKSATGRGARNGMTAAGYFTGNLFIPGYQIPGELEETRRDVPYASPLKILIEGSNGVSRYGNQLGVPVIFGFCRTFGQVVAGELRQPFKPILYAGGNGDLFHDQVVKAEPEKLMKIIAIGGPAFRIGLGGGSASSMIHGENNAELDFKSVQRGNAEMENRTNRVIVACSEMGDKNPIASIHDQGAGGPSNVLSELMGKAGGKIDIRQINVGDSTMSVLEIWSAEYQERYGLLIYPERLALFQEICERERVPCEVLGEITGDGNIVVCDSLNNTTPVNLDLETILGNLPQKEWKSDRPGRNLPPFELPKNLTVADALCKVSRLPSVGSKDFLVNKVDNHVGGRIIESQRRGIAQIPISDYALCATGFFDNVGTVAALGENPNRILINPASGVRMVLAEMLTNMAGVKIDGIHAIRGRANWMGPVKLPGEGALFYDAVSAMSEFLIEAGFAIDGGKDSSSMATIIGNETVKAPTSLVFLGYASVPDFNVRVTPEIKKPGKSFLGLIDLGLGKNRMGGSALAQACGQLGNESPDVTGELMVRAFTAVQQMVAEEVILALHDRSDGGLMVAVAEMCMASNCGFHINVNSATTAMAELFSEEAGWVVELDAADMKRVDEICDQHGIPFEMLGITSLGQMCCVDSRAEDRMFTGDISAIRADWNATSLELEKQQKTPACVESERANILLNGSISPKDALAYRLTFKPEKTPFAHVHATDKPKMAVLREEGTNGDAEMRAFFFAGGFEVYDFAMTDLLSGRANLDDVQFLVPAGGFSYMDVPFSAGKGWAEVIRGNEKLSAMFDRFYARPDTLSLGVCNGAQLSTLLGWVPRKGIAREKQPRLIQNLSLKFESPWVQVEILKNPAILFDGMEGSRLGIWVAHGEGRFFFPDKAIYEEVLQNNLVSMAYLDPYGHITEQYPYNPNGSPKGIAALCSLNGRHVAMMPHPERVFCLSRWSWMPASWKNLVASPWLRISQNAFEWCRRNRAA